VALAAVGMLLREQTVLLPATILAGIFIKVIIFRKRDHFTLRTISLVLLPYLVFIIFLFVQRKENGWFFYPYHLELITRNLTEVIARLIFYVQFVFLDQGRILWIVLFAMVLLLFIARRKKFAFKDWMVSFKGNFIFFQFVLWLTYLSFSSLNVVVVRYSLFLFPWLILLIMILLTEIFRWKKIPGFIF